MTPLPRKKLVEKARRLLAAEERLRGEILRRKKEESIRYFEPHEKQQAFLEDDSQTVVAFGGNRSGKTHVSMVKLVSFALGFRPWLEPEDPRYKVGVPTPAKCLVVGESFGTAIKDTIIPKLLGDPDNGVPGLLPSTAIKSLKRNAQGIVTEIKLNNGSRIVCMSYDQTVDLFEGTDWDCVAFDEPPPRSIYIAVQRGLVDRGGKCWIACTPLKEPWIFDDLVNTNGVPLYTFFLDDNPHIGDEEKAAWIKNLSPEEYRVRVLGEPLQLEGLIYGVYSRNQDVFRIERFQIPSHWPVWCSIDPHPRTRHHAVWGTVRENGDLLIIGELMNKDADNRIQPFCEDLLDYERNILGIDPVRMDGMRLMDPSGFTTLDGQSIHDKFVDYSDHLFCRAGSKELTHAIVVTKDLMMINKESMIMPRIFFFNDLPGLHKELTRYSWQEWTGKSKDLRAPRAQPRDKDDHFIECMHRIVLDNPQYEPVTFENVQSYDYQTDYRGPSKGY